MAVSNGAKYLPITQFGDEVSSYFVRNADNAGQAFQLKSCPENLIMSPSFDGLFYSDRFHINDSPTLIKVLLIFPDYFLIFKQFLMYF